MVIAMKEFLDIVNAKGEPTGQVVARDTAHDNGRTSDGKGHGYGFINVKQEEEDMKLAEALQERADINKKISELKRRLENCLLVQEGEEPAEDPIVLLNELDSATDRLEKLMASINETNCNTKANGMSLTEIIARKDALSIRYSAYKELVYTAGNNTYRARGSEIKVKAVVKAAELQKTVDKLAKEIRLLDNLLQETNWKTELVEK
jgi:hypothetical protein